VCILHRHTSDSPHYFYLFFTAPTAAHGRTPEMSFHTNAHLLIEFGLSLFITMLKRMKIDREDTEFEAMLGPFTSLLTDCLHSKYNKVRCGPAFLCCAMLCSPFHSLAGHGADAQVDDTAAQGQAGGARA
jgi:hypothetical protein